MARKTVTFTATAKRDAGKVFVITEMSAAQAEKWAARAMLAMMRGGVQIPDNVVEMGFAGLAVIGMRSMENMPWEEAEPLMDEMWHCVAFVPDANKPEVRRAVIDDDIEEVKTRFDIRREILRLHLDFFMSAAP